MILKTQIFKPVSVTYQSSYQKNSIHSGILFAKQIFCVNLKEALS